MKQRIHEILEVAREGDRPSRFFDIFIVALIAVNVGALILGTVEGLYAAAPLIFHGLEVVSVAVFTVEYALRIWSCTADPRYRAPLRGRARFALTPLALIDLLAIAPFYAALITGFVGIDLRFLRALRLFRIFRIVKLARYSTSLQLLGRVVSSRREELVTTLLILLLLLVIASCLMFYAEQEVQPELFSSIPATMWWGIATLTTVGYGDMFPVTAIGKLIGSVITILGIGMFALPTGILGAGFVEEIQRRKRPRTCPRCGARVDGDSQERV